MKNDPAATWCMIARNTGRQHQYKTASAINHTAPITIDTMKPRGSSSAIPALPLRQRRMIANAISSTPTTRYTFTPMSMDGPASASTCIAGTRPMSGANIAATSSSTRSTPLPEIAKSPNDTAMSEPTKRLRAGES